MSGAAIAFRDRLRGGAPLLLDGAIGTELTRRGVDTALPLWSAAALLSAPDVLLEIHRGYVAAGAEIITANTFRAHQRSLAAGGLGERSAAMVGRAVELVRQAIEGAAPAESAPAESAPEPARQGGPASRDRFVGGSVAPLEDCYEPERVPDDDALAREHAALAEALAAAGVDVLLLETMNTIREARAAARAAVATGLPTLASFVCGRDGRLLSGEAVGEAGRALAGEGVDGVMINCAPAPDLHRALGELAAAVDLPVGAYGNVGYADPSQGWVNTDSVDPEAYARYAATWLRIGARVIGSCCGTGPAHTRALRSLIDGAA